MYLQGSTSLVHRPETSVKTIVHGLPCFDQAAVDLYVLQV